LRNLSDPSFVSGIRAPPADIARIADAARHPRGPPPGWPPRTPPGSPGANAASGMPAAFSTLCA